MKRILILLILPVASCFSQVVDMHEKFNVLYIMVDDLCPQLGTYNHEAMKTHHMDKLAEEGFKFNRAYCNVPVCGASRVSLLTGERPLWPQRFKNFLTYAEKDCPSVVTLPQYFTQNGYYTISNEKEKIRI